MREVTIDGQIAGYAANDEQGRDIADRFIFENMAESGCSRPVANIPQGARRLDLDQQMRSGRSYR